MLNLLSVCKSEIKWFFFSEIFFSATIHWIDHMTKKFEIKFRNFSLFSGGIYPFSKDNLSSLKRDCTSTLWTLITQQQCSYYRFDRDLDWLIVTFQLGLWLINCHNPRYEFWASKQTVVWWINTLIVSHVWWYMIRREFLRIFHHSQMNNEFNILFLLSTYWRNHNQSMITSIFSCKKI